MVIIWILDFHLKYLILLPQEDYNYHLLQTVIEN